MSPRCSRTPRPPVPSKPAAPSKAPPKGEACPARRRRRGRDLSPRPGPPPRRWQHGELAAGQHRGGRGPRSGTPLPRWGAAAARRSAPAAARASRGGRAPVQGGQVVAVGGRVAGVGDDADDGAPQRGALQEPAAHQLHVARRVHARPHGRAGQQDALMGEQQREAAGDLDRAPRRHGPARPAPLRFPAHRPHGGSAPLRAPGRAAPAPAPLPLGRAAPCASSAQRSRVRSASSGAGAGTSPPGSLFIFLPRFPPAFERQSSLRDTAPAPLDGAASATRCQAGSYHLFRL